MAHPDLPAEQVHVDHAYRRLEAMRASADAMLRDAFRQRGGTFQSFTERDIMVRTSLGRLDHLQIGEEALVFGRIDRRNDTAAGSSVEAFHIGRLAISDERQEPLVVDWRAPVAEPFYRATGAHPMGLTRRRHFLTEGRRVLDLEDELFEHEGADEGAGLGLSGPQVLLSVLQRSRTGRMRDIVATVQREQDEIIRSPLGGVLVVQGGPGTGKTAVALHRAAYLLYTHRFPLERQGVLVVGPNPTFLRYIEQVLPSLGESGVELSTIAGLVPDIHPSGTEAEPVARLKGDPRMARLLANAVTDRQRALPRAIEIPYGHMVLRLSRGASARITAAARRRGGAHNSRRRLVETLLWRELRSELVRHQAAATPAGLEAPEPPPAAELGRDLRRVREVTLALERMWPVLTPEELLRDLFGAKPLLDLAARDLLSTDECALLLRERAAGPSGTGWTRDDVALLDEASALLGPRRRRAAATEPGEARGYGHIVVDEAQDLSPMQLRMLARRSLSGSMTVVGDIAQATGSWTPGGWAEVVEHLPAGRSWRQVELTVNYRTPSEIMDLAGRVLAVAAPGMLPPESVREGGRPPRLVPVLGGGVARSSARVAAEELVWLRAEAGGGTVAVVVPSSLLALVADELELAGVSFGQVGRGALDTEVSLLAVDDAKGLEFDDVVVVEPAAIARESPSAYRAVYVAMTRATRSLSVVHAEPLPSPFEEPTPTSRPVPGLAATPETGGTVSGAAMPAPSTGGD